MRFGSVCSGIESASVAWHPLGWRAARFAEVDGGASAVLAFRFPDVPNLGDMTRLAARVRAREIEAPDALVGGTPCQSFSVAGMRRGLADERGQLTIAFIDLADAIDEVRQADGKPPVIIIWENVPGVLNHKDNPFGCFLAGLAGEGDALLPARRKWANAGVVLGPKRAIAWRTLDAQFFRLAQRRRRVFVVASARPGFDPGGILFEFEGLRRDSPPSREAGEGVAGTLDARADGGGFPGTDGACSGHDVPAHRISGPPAGESGAVGGGGARADGSGADHLPAGVAFGGANCSGPIAVAAALNASERYDFDSETFVLQRNPGQENVIAFDPRGTDVLVHGSERVAALDTKFLGPAIVFSSKDFGGDASEEVSPTLRAGGHTDSHANGGVPPAVAYAVSENQRAEVRLSDVVRSLAAGGGKPGQGYSAALVESRVNPPPEVEPGHIHPRQIRNSQLVGIKPDTKIADALTSEGPGAVLQHMAVRRLMPVECERLQGFPDGWSLVPVRRASAARAKKLRAAGPDRSWAEIDGEAWLLAADGPRYKQLGNSMATHVMHWIGRRIDRAVSVSVRPANRIAELIG